SHSLTSADSYSDSASSDSFINSKTAVRFRPLRRTRASYKGEISRPDSSSSSSCSSHSSPNYRTKRRQHLQNRKPGPRKLRQVVLSDPSSDSYDEEIIKSHRSWCEHCGKSGKKQEKDRKKNEDADKLLVLCDLCSCSYHWGCIPQQRKSKKIHKTFRCTKCIRHKSTVKCMICNLDINGISAKRQAEKGEDENDTDGNQRMKLRERKEVKMKVEDDDEGRRIKGKKRQMNIDELIKTYRRKWK
ncbi:7758_t:CDS:2, partial [Paraglomus occultum]